MVVWQQIQVKQTAAEKGVVKYLLGSVRTSHLIDTVDAWEMGTSYDLGGF